MMLRVGAVLLADLKHLFACSFGRLRDGSRVLDGRGQRGFAIDMLARLEGGDGHLAVLGPAR